MRALLLHHPFTAARFEQDFVDQIGELSEFDVAAADLVALDAGVLATTNGPVALSQFDAVIVFVAFHRLRAAPTLAWGGYSGLRVLMDHDVIQNYSTIFDASLNGTWPPVFHRHRFDSIVTSGRAIQERLADDGIPADWVPKGFDPTRFVNTPGRRAGIATYGSAYACRQLAERALRDARLPVTRLPTTPYVTLGTTLHRFLGCLAISSDIDLPLDRRDALESVRALEVPIRPGLEPMAKFFESAGAGCCPIADAMDDVHALGFRDGETALTFRTHAELVEKLRAALATPGTLQAIGTAAATLAHAEHTWAHRARALREAVGLRLQRSTGAN